MFIMVGSHWMVASSAASTSMVQPSHIFYFFFLKFKKERRKTNYVVWVEGRGDLVKKHRWWCNCFSIFFLLILSPLLLMHSLISLHLEFSKLQENYVIGLDANLKIFFSLETFIHGIPLIFLFVIWRKDVQ
jgi:hypothetical protein